MIILENIITCDNIIQYYIDDENFASILHFWYKNIKWYFLWSNTYGASLPIYEWLIVLTTVMLTKGHKNYATNIDICSKKQGLIPY